MKNQSDLSTVFYSWIWNGFMLTLILSCIAPQSTGQVPVLSQEEWTEDLTVFIDAIEHHPGLYLWRS